VTTRRGRADLLAKGRRPQVSRYEVLRSRATQSRPSGVCRGLAILLQQGVAAWMAAWAALPAPRQRPATPSLPPVPCVGTSGTSAQLVNVLAAMALGHVQGGRA